MAQEQALTQLLFLVKGTRGDVQPAAVLAQAVATRCADVHVTLATHATHEVR